MRRTGMGMAALAALVVLALGTGLAAGSDQPSFEVENCGGVVLEGVGAYAIQARRMSCRNSRNLAMRWMATSSCGTYVCRIRRFRCYERRIREDVLRVRCVRKPAVVS